MKEAKLQVVKFENADVIATSGFNPTAATFFMPDNIGYNQNSSYDWNLLLDGQPYNANANVLFSDGLNKTYSADGSLFDCANISFHKGNLKYYSVNEATNNVAGSMEDVINWINYHGVAGYHEDQGL